jgi:glycosyltransferase involved in cell wall biosynthesis
MNDRLAEATGDGSGARSARPPRLRKVVLSWLATAPGGGEKSVALLAQHLSQYSGVAVEVVWWAFDGATKPEIAEGADIRTRCVSDISGYTDALRSALSGQAGETVLISSQRTVQVDVGIAGVGGVPVLSVLRGLFLEEHSLRYLVSVADPQLAPLFPWELDWEVLRGVDAWIGISRTSSESIRAFAGAGTRVETIYNGVEPPRRAVDAGPRRVRKFVIVSRAVGWKRLPMLFDGFVKAIERHPDLSLDVVGDGPLMAEYEDLVRNRGLAERIAFRGWQDDVYHWLESADVLLHGAKVEGFGRAIAEAAVVGRPAIVPSDGATGELVVPGVTGLTYRSDDVDDVAARIEEAASWSPERWQRMSDATASFGRSLLTSARNSSEYLVLCNDVLRRRAGH